MNDNTKAFDVAYSNMCATISKRALFPEGSAVLLMVSGGSDSTALAYLMSKYRDEHPGHIAAMCMFHMNHKLRGSQADADACFVAKLADLLSIPLFSCEMDIGAEAARLGENIEAFARKERYASSYEALTSMCHHEGIPLNSACIATAHTLDDRVENFYMRSIVGTGPGGFRSMLFSNGNIRRPLLECTRDELRAAIEDIAGKNSGFKYDAARDEDNLLWREDATNAHTDRFRAYVRHKMVPVAESWSGEFRHTLARTMDLIADEDDMIQEMTSNLIQEQSSMIEPASPEDGFILEPSFGNSPRPLQRRAVHKMLKTMIGLDERIDTASVEAILDSFSGGAPISGRVVNIQGNIAVSANKKGVRIEPMAAFRARRKRTNTK